MGFEKDDKLYTVFWGDAAKNKKKKPLSLMFMRNFLEVNQKTEFSHSGTILYFLPREPQMLTTHFSSKT